MRMHKALVVYDSFYGNTQAIAEAIAGALEGEVLLRRAADLKGEAMEGSYLFVIGSPTRAFRPAPDVAAFLRNLPGETIRKSDFLFFDTSYQTGEIKVAILRFMAGIFGSAAPAMSKDLRKRGGRVLGHRSFYVTGEKGPLAPGEGERAAAWVRGLSL